ncbi:MAG: ATPase [Alphaproteobacteria bacterium]|nr:ATPase [Alphaproteobacteria bacterium]
MSDVGFPQLDPSSYPSQLFWLAVTFVVMYVLLSKIALPRVAKVLEVRQSQKDGDLTKAGQLSEEAEKIRGTYEKSLAEARQVAATTLSSSNHALSEKITEVESRFAENSHRRLVAAEQNIARVKAEAMLSILDISAEVAAAIAHKVADVRFSDADAKKAVATIMQKG